jgi:hypothetical protein
LKMGLLDNAPQGTEDNTPWYDKVSGFMGLGDNKTVDPTTGLTPQQQHLIGYNQLGQLGALLMAAGQKQMPAERAKYLAQIGQIPAEAAKQQSVMQQAQLRQAQMQKLKVEMDQLKAWQSLINGTGGNGTATAAAARPSSGATLSAGINPPLFGGNPPAEPIAAEVNPGQPPIAQPIPPNALLRAGNNQPMAQTINPNVGQTEGQPSGPTTGATLNSPTIPNIVRNMDPYSRAALVSLGASAGPQLLLKESFDAAARNQQIQAQKEMEERKLQTDVVRLPITNADGSMTEIVVPKAQLPQKMAELQKNNIVVGKPEYSPEQKKISEGYGELYTNLQDSRRSSTDLNARLSQMDAAAANFAPGKGATQFYNAAAWLNSYLPGSFIPEGMDVKKVDNYQEFSKLATQYATERARTLGAREAASVVQMMVNANPNPEMTPDAIRRIGAGLRAQNDYAVDKANSADAWLTDPKNKGSLRGFENQFIKDNPPERYILPHLTQDDLREIPTPILKKMMRQ